MKIEHYEEKGISFFEKIKKTSLTGGNMSPEFLLYCSVVRLKDGRKARNGSFAIDL